jgi:thiol-disulfide isomerase/thioredoxin
MLAGLGGAVAAAASPRNSSGQAIDHPPPMANARHQFEILVPAKILPPIVAIGLDGKPARLAPVPGKILLVNIWATWCELCRVELPMLDRFQASTGSAIDVVAVAAEKAPPAKVRNFIDNLHIRHLKILLDPEEKIASSAESNDAPLRIYGMPMTYLIAPTGRIAGDILGATDWLAPDAQSLLEYYSRT